MKKNILLIVILILLTVCNIVYNESQLPKEIVLSPKQIQKYEVYKIDLSENTTAEEIIEICEESSQTTVQSLIYDLEFIEYESTQLSDFLYKFKEPIGIEYSNNNFLYISYKTYDNENVVLTYTSQGFKQLVIYNKAKDTMLIIYDEPDDYYGVIFKNGQPTRGRYWKHWKHLDSNKIFSRR